MPARTHAGPTAWSKDRIDDRTPGARLLLMAFAAVVLIAIGGCGEIVV